MPNCINKSSLPPNLYQLLCAIFSNNQIWWIVPYSELRHLHQTNWWLKICIWRLYFSSWLPKGDRRIFLISSPALYEFGQEKANEDEYQHVDPSKHVIKVWIILFWMYNKTAILGFSFCMISRIMQILEGIIRWSQTRSSICTILQIIHSLVQYSPLPPCGHPTITDTELTWTEAKSPAKTDHRCLTEINSNYYRFSLTRTLTRAPYSVHYKESWLYLQILETDLYYVHFLSSWENLFKCQIIFPKVILYILMSNSYNNILIILWQPNWTRPMVLSIFGGPQHVFHPIICKLDSM